MLRGRASDAVFSRKGGRPKTHQKGEHLGRGRNPEAFLVKIARAYFVLLLFIFHALLRPSSVFSSRSILL
jgi:hypothetical protein